MGSGGLRYRGEEEYEEEEEEDNGSEDDGKKTKVDQNILVEIYYKAWRRERGWNH